MKTLKDNKNCVDIVFMHVLIIVRLVLNGHFSAHLVIHNRLNAEFFDNFLGYFIRITPQKSQYFHQFLKKIVLSINGLTSHRNVPQCKSITASYL